MATETPDTQATLTAYAEQTAADSGVDFKTAVRMMNDEPQLVAAEAGCTVEDVQAFVRVEG